MSDDPLSDACTECWFSRGATMRTKPQWWSLWRAVPLLLVGALLAWLLWHDHTASVTQSTWSTDVHRKQTMPEILDSIPVALATVRQIAEGSAGREDTDRFRAALVDALEHGLPPFNALPETRGAFVSAGFVAPPATLREDLGLGWPFHYIWSVRILKLDDPVAAARTLQLPAEPAHLWFPKWPSRGGKFWAIPWRLWSYELGPQVWNLGYGELRYSENERSSTQLSDDVRVSAIKLDVLSVPLLALWCAVILAGLFVHGWKRVLVVVVCALVVVLLFAAFPTKRLMQSRGWHPAPSGSSEMWRDVASLGLRIADVQAMLERPDGCREVAALLLERAPRENTAGTQYLALALGPTWLRDEWHWRFNHEKSIATYTRSDDAAYIPEAVKAMPRASGLSVSLVHHDLRVLLRRDSRSTQNESVRIHLGWTGWILLILLAAWSWPAHFVSSVRRRRIRRRTQRGQCACCAHPFPPQTSS